MVIKFGGKDCCNCPFFWVEYCADLRKCEEIEWTGCLLHDRFDYEGDKGLKIILGKNSIRKGDCPFKNGNEVKIINEE